MKKSLLIIVSLFIAVTSIFAGEGTGFHWPKEIVKDKTTVTLYQPQYDSFNNNILEGRMALSVKIKDQELIFGALWFKARLATDLEERTAVIENLDIERVYFPGIEDTTKIEKFSRLLTEEVESWDVVMSLDRLIASLKEVEDMKSLSENLNNTPPDIYFRTSPSVLISIDGEAKLKEIEGAGFKYVVNTPFFIVKDSKGKYYIKGGKFWYVSNQVSSGYKHTEKVPSDIEKFAAGNLQDGEMDSISMSITEAPELIVVTKASELVSTDGEPDYASIEGTGLLYVSNSSEDIVMDINTQQHFVLIAGRWYASKSLNDGDWKFVEPKDLPEDFSKIPEDSDMGNVRASVPGTPEAEEALLEQSVPQTATVDRKTTTVEVQWDGDPKFEKIEGTDVAVAKNTDKTVLLIKKKYYCVDDAIWFVADKPTGPWVVSDVRPDEVDQIPPESEAYNVKYVYIYESTPEVVYVGYLPGYNYSYVYGGTVVYGTGYNYRPWYGAYYYPRPVTYGFGVHYNPWTGWGFSVGFSFGWVGWGFHPYGRAMWGPRGYHRGYRHGYNRGYHHGYNRGYSRGARAGYAAGSRNSNVYKNRGGGVKTADRTRPAQGNKNLNKKARPSTKPNNVYTDKKGNVYQRDKSGNWENKNNKATRPSQKPATKPNQKPTQKPGQKPATKPSQRPANQPSQKPGQKPARQPQTRPSTGQNQRPSSGMSNQQKQNLNRSHQNRSTGTQNYNRSRSSGYSGGSRGGGASRGGGGGRRR
ncbi:MAG: hypothetical protein L3J66_03220 [Bacteroidales bacterium]|nr:hypothetical protein [Bacteroidales bacterium]